MTVLLSVALLLAGASSVVPAGTAMVAVLVIVPEALTSTGAVTVNVALPPVNRFTVVLRLPLPLAGQLDPAVAAHVQVMPATLKTLGSKVSVTGAAVTALGPALLATMV